MPRRGKVGEAASPRCQRVQPTPRPNARSASTTTAPETMLQQPAMAKLGADPTHGNAQLLDA